ncbi:MAG: hypothetical protein M1840_006032 [Geoglossum simile]|nr:MAG: hypothetical protein M1840_006032 [Geoglossum simile]
MKYGQTLLLRSIPEWGPYNVEYNEIKHLIKVRTTRDQAHAISIPGRGDGENTALKEFEDELYAELSEQHQRIDLFVFSKSGEVSRRLNHLDKQVLQLIGRPKPSARTRISVRRLEKFSKAEEEVLKAGEEIQSLSRFVGAQRLAFQKLLKKYKKWTGSSTLGKRFRQEVLDQPTSFSNINLEPLVAEWAAVLAAVREPFKDGVSLEPGYGGQRVSVVQFPHKGKNRHKVAENSTKESNGAASPGQLGGSTSATQIQSAAEHGADVDFDTALATLPLGYTAGKATYWIHPDNLVELQVLLLQHMRTRSGQGKMQTTSPTSPSPTMSRRSSLTWKSGFGAEERGEEAGLVIFDDLERFAKDQSATTIGEVEDRAGRITEKAAASVRWCADSEAVVIVGTTPLGSPESADLRGASNQRPVTAKLKKKNIPALFDLTQPFPAQRRGSDLITYGAEPTDAPARNLEEVRAWLYCHKEIRPLVQIRSKRTRFCSPKNNFTQGTWAVLDRDIKMEKAHLEEMVKTRTLTPPMESQEICITPASSDDGSVEFPYAVLEVRWEGDEELNLVPALDNSHLTERIRGFSTETHAVAVLHNPQSMPPPFWLPALEKDIRKLPISCSPSARRPSTAANTSTSATSTTDGPSSALTEPAQESSATSETDLLQSFHPSAPKKKRRMPYREHPLRRRLDQEESLAGERYWNEYDDADEALDSEPYTIFIDPSEPSGFPGVEGIADLKNAVVAKLQSASVKIKHWFESRPKAGEQQPLLGGFSASRFVPYDTDPEDSSSAGRALFSRRYYSTIVEQEAQQALLIREHFLVCSYTACFIVSILLLVLVYVLAVTGKHKFHVPVDLGVIVGVIASLSFAVAGMGMMLVRKTRVGYTQKFVVLAVFGAICVASGVLLALVGSGG